MEEAADKPSQPKLQSFLLADEIYVDAQTKKKVICGTFNSIWVDKVPSDLPRTVKAYLCLLGCRGRFGIELKYVDLKDLSVLISSQRVDFEHADPLMPLEVVMGVPPLPVPHPGQFAFEAYCDGELIGAIRVSAEQRPQGEEHK